MPMFQYQWPVLARAVQHIGYCVTAPSGEETSYYVPFEQLLVKKDGKWLILMERQLEAGDEAAWAALR